MKCSNLQRFSMVFVAAAMLVTFYGGAVRADSLAGLPDVNVADNAIVDLTHDGTTYVVADGDLVLGETTRWYIPVGTSEPVLWEEGTAAPVATVSGTSTPKEDDVGSNADNFMFRTPTDATNISSIDGIDFQETIFSSPKDTFFLFERGGNDSGTFQAILGDGSLGPDVAFSPGSAYADTGIGVNGQNAYGVVFTTDEPVAGVRITASGHDTLSISAPIPEPSTMILAACGALTLGLYFCRRKRS